MDCSPKFTADWLCLVRWPSLWCVARSPARSANDLTLISAVLQSVNALVELTLFFAAVSARQQVDASKRFVLDRIPKVGITDLLAEVDGDISNPCLVLPQGRVGALDGLHACLRTFRQAVKQ